MIDKKVIGIVVAALIIATPVAVFSDDIQGALNNTIAPDNGTNTSDSSNTTKIQNNSTGGTTVSKEEGTGTSQGTTEAAASDSGSTTTESTGNTWENNPKIKYNPAGHVNKNSPMVQYGNESKY